nr:hypothetical protein [Tanacetum cinerariifolium]
MRRVGKGFLRVETPLFEGMLVGVIEEGGDADEQVQDVAADTVAQGADTAAIGDEALDACVALTRQVEHLEHDKVAQALEITKLKRRVKKLERGMIDSLDSDAGVALMDDKEEEKKAEEAKVASDDQVQGRQAEIYKIDMNHASKVLSMQEDEPEVHEVEMDEEYARKLHEELNKDIDWDVAIDHVKQKAKEDPFVQRYQVMKKMPQTEAQARNNKIMYLKNVAGFRLDYSKGMSYDEIRPIFEAKFNSNIAFLLKSKEQLEEEENRAIESINETPA